MQDRWRGIHCFGGVPTTERHHFHIKRSNSDILGWQGCHVSQIHMGPTCSVCRERCPYCLDGQFTALLPSWCWARLECRIVRCGSLFTHGRWSKKNSKNFNYGDELWYSKLKVKAYSEERVREAESVCRLIPAANPWYQYNLHSPVDRIGRYIFTVKKVNKSKVFSATQKLSNALGVPNVIMRPSVLSLLARSNPPLVYSNIFRQYRHNSLVLQSMVLIGSIFLCKLFGCDIIRVLFRRLRTASLLQMVNWSKGLKLWFASVHSKSADWTRFRSAYDV